MSTVIGNERIKQDEVKGKASLRIARSYVSCVDAQRLRCHKGRYGNGA